MACKPAPALLQAKAEAKQRWGITTGICGERSNKSDHPVGNAADFMCNRAQGDEILALLLGSKDPRIKYIIWQRRIYGPGSHGGWPGASYNGKNPHTDHVHLSIYEKGREDTSPWFGGSPGIVDTAVGVGANLLDPFNFWHDAGGIKNPLSSIQDALKAIGDILGFISDPENWMRLGMFVGGLAALYGGIALFVADTKVARTALDVAGGAVSGGTVDLEQIAA